MYVVIKSIIVTSSSSGRSILFFRAKTNASIHTILVVTILLSKLFHVRVLARGVRAAPGTAAAVVVVFGVGPLFQVEELLHLLERVGRVAHRVADGAGVAVDLVVVAALFGLVAEEVDRGVGDAVGLLGLVLEVRQAVGLVPAGREDVEGDLAADRVSVGKMVF